MATETTAQAPATPIADGLAIIRHHIVLIAMAATLTFGWLMTEEYPWALALIAGLDWFLINLLNRVTDLDEDLANGIQGTERVARRKRVVTIASAALLVGSFGSHAFFPALTPLRVAVQAIGMAYNYRIVPTPRGLARLKEIYFFKNFGSACIFVLTCFGYPLADAGWMPAIAWPAILALVVFFVLFEITFEILYDLRDLPGDTAARIPTYPVVHGPLAARRIIDSPRYRRAYGHMFAMTTDQNVKTRYENDKGGRRIVTSTGAALSTQKCVKATIQVRWTGSGNMTRSRQITTLLTKGGL